MNPSSPIDILIIDDHLGRDTFRQQSLQSLGDPIGVRLAFCAGQTSDNGVLRNDASQAVAAVAAADAAGANWALVLVDMQFTSGALDANGVPAGGGAEDQTFGSVIEAALLRRFPDLPIARFTTLHEKDLPQSGGSAFVSKHGLTTERLVLALVRHGRLDGWRRRALLRIPDDTAFISRQMFDLYALAYRYAQSDEPILILGETGTGKEHLARFIHDVSPHAQARFVAVNVSGFAADLFEAEMFGSTKGAYTGASATRGGLVESARGGTLFLDEIGDLASAHQSKILRFAQGRHYRAVGSTVDETGDCLVVAATSRPLDQWAGEADGRFRDDLLQRFGRRLRIPPLRERPEDVHALIAHGLQIAMRKSGSTGVEIEPATADAITRASLPGNARELLHGIVNAVDVAQSYSLLRQDSFPPSWFAAASQAPASTQPRAPQAGDAPQPLQVATGVDALAEAMASFRVDPHDTALRGALPRLEAAWQTVQEQLALAALERERHHSGKLMMLPAIQVLMGDTKVTSAYSKRAINSLLGRKQDAEIDLQELDGLVRARAKKGEA